MTSQPAVRRTQDRRIGKAATLLGFHPAQADQERERIATRLGVPTMILRSSTTRWRAGWIARGLAVLAVLAAIPRAGSLLDDLLSAGYAAALWARPRRWDSRRWVLARQDGPYDRGPPTHDFAARPGTEAPPPYLP